MAATLPQAIEKFSEAGNAMMVGVGKSIVTSDEMSLMLPIRGVAGPGLMYKREGILPTGGVFIDDTGVTSEESSGRPDYVQQPFRRIVGNVDTDSLLNAFTNGAEEDDQLVRKVKATWRKVQLTNITGNYATGHTFSPAAAPITAITAIDYGPGLDSNRKGPGSIRYTHAGTLWQFRAPGDVDYGDAVPAASNGTYTLRSHNPSKYIIATITVATATANGESQVRFTTTTNEYEGMQELCAPSQIIAPTNSTNGDAFDLAHLDALMELVKVGDKSNLAFVMTTKMYNKVKAAARALGGTTPEQISRGQMIVPAYDGIAILRNDFIPNEAYTGNTASSIYLACMDDSNGLFMGVANAAGDNFNVDTDVTTKPVMGFQIDRFGALEGKDASRQRVKFYGALGLKSELALARRRGIIVTTP